LKIDEKKVKKKVCRREINEYAKKNVGFYAFFELTFFTAFVEGSNDGVFPV